jgi:hypothetical protein
MLALPPMEKRMRKLVHDLAGAFNLTSKSEGNGKARFTTLTRTTMSGVRVDERKLARILGKPKPDGGGGGGKGKGKAVGKIRPRDGEVVGGVSVFSTRSLIYLLFVGCTEDRWVESRIQDVGGHGMARGYSDRCCRRSREWIGGSALGCDQNHKAGAWCELRLAQGLKYGRLRAAVLRSLTICYHLTSDTQCISLSHFRSCAQ